MLLFKVVAVFISCNRTRLWSYLFVRDIYKTTDGTVYVDEVGLYETKTATLKMNTRIKVTVYDESV